MRKQNFEQADKRAFKEYSEYGHDDPFFYGYPGGPMSASRPNFSATPSYQSSHHSNSRRRSASSTSSTYGYPLPHMPSHMRKPRPIIVASAIEKSDFRTHLDGMSSSLRGKLGGLIKGKKDNAEKPKPRPFTSTMNSDIPNRSENYTPSVDAVPSLTSSTSPSEGQATLSSSGHHTPSSRQRQQQESVIHKIRRFEGGGKLPQLGWKSLSNNPELWDEKGDTFVYMYMQASRTKPPPSFRINSRIIKQSGSKAFIDRLYNVTEPEGWPQFHPNDEHALREESPEDADMYNAYGSHGEDGDIDAIRPVDDSKPHVQRAPSGIQHEIYIPWPGAETGIHSTIWHITTRNFFAVMYDASALVGTTLHEAMTKLSERIVMYPDYLDKSINKVDWITDYIVRHKFDDVRNNPSYAASLLAFSEAPGVQWREGYIEAFVHCVGMLDMGLQTIPEWRHVTPHTKMFLQNASMEIEERITRAQGWLLSFDFGEMWPHTALPASVTRGCFDRLRKWLCKYYENAFLHWPPTNDQIWLTRDTVMRLKNDFEGLYDYLVDRDVMFDGTEYRPGQKWAITSRSGQNFRADTFELPFTDILLGFDKRNDFPHIPHPYPITPTSVPTQSKSKSTWIVKKPISPADLLAQSRRKALSYAEASNVYTLRDQYMHTDLVTNFIRFEQSDQVETLDPFEARRGRWILIYGVLQVLATISVDSPNLRFKEGAQYHLCPQMKGVVPWAERGSPPEAEAEHKRSHCWVIPETWGPVLPKARPNAHKPILWGQYGDGRTRGASSESDPTLDPPGPKPHDASLGRKRAEEWVATSGGPEVGMGDIGSEMNANNMDEVRSTVKSEGSGEHSTESAAEAARRRRAMVHGFTDFQPPSEW